MSAEAELREWADSGDPIAAALLATADNDRYRAGLQAILDAETIGETHAIAALVRNHGA